MALSLLTEEHHQERREGVMHRHDMERTIVSVIACCLITMHTLAVAAEADGSSVLSGSQRPSPTEKTGGTALNSNRVKTPDRKVAGEIKDFVVALEAGRITYAVLSPHTYSARAKQLVIVPWTALDLDSPGNTASVILDKATLWTAPTVSMESWTHTPMAQCLAIVDKYWRKRSEPSIASSSIAATGVVKASALLGRQVHGDNGEALGAIRELMIDPQAGLLTYVILARENRENRSAPLVLRLPWTTLFVTPADHRLMAHLGVKTIL
jgi:sporulation protein YlmC with PRC-barrel domain